MAHRRTRVPAIGIGVLVSLFVVTGVVVAARVPEGTAGPSATRTVAVDAATATAVAATAPVLAAPPTIAATATPSPTATPVTTAAPGTKPWLAWKPSGAGQVTRYNMAAPWIGGTTTDVSIYTPPGYDPNGTRLYPVIYEAPTGLTLWSSGGATAAQLDSLIDSGAMPAAIAVFIDESSPPLSPSECADSTDGQQWFETFISNTVVNWVDVTYKTIQDPRARAIMGMSEGGFCAAMLATRHPDVFGTSISFSGYFWAGVAGADAVVPFGSQTVLDAHSPALLVPQLAAATLAEMYFIVVADPTQEFFGTQATSFDKILSQTGANHLAVNSDYGHGWDEVRVENPPVMAAWAAQMVRTGVW